MKREAAFAHFAIDDDRKQRLQTAADKHIQDSYSSGIKQAGKTVGKNLRNVIINDKRSLDKIHRKSRTTANRMQKTYNTMLESALNNLPEPMTKEEYREKLEPFFETINQHNGDKLTPYLTDWAQQSALRDFYAVNEIQAIWHVASPERPPTRGSECEVALSLAPMSTTQATQFEFPAHHNCEHRLVPSEPKNIPEGLWTGRESQSGKKHLISLHIGEKTDED